MRDSTVFVKKIDSGVDFVFDVFINERYVIVRKNFISTVEIRLISRRGGEKGTVT